MEMATLTAGHHGCRRPYPGSEITGLTVVPAAAAAAAAPLSRRPVVDKTPPLLTPLPATPAAAAAAAAAAVAAAVGVPGVLVNVAFVADAATLPL